MLNKPEDATKEFFSKDFALVSVSKSLHGVLVLASFGAGRQSVRQTNSFLFRLFLAKVFNSTKKQTRTHAAVPFHVGHSMEHGEYFHQCEKVNKRKRNGVQKWSKLKTSKK